MEYSCVNVKVKFCIVRRGYLIQGMCFIVSENKLCMYREILCSSCGLSLNVWRSGVVCVYTRTSERN